MRSLAYRRRRVSDRKSAPVPAAQPDTEAALAGRPLAAGGVMDFELMQLHPLGVFEVLLAGGLPT